MLRVSLIAAVWLVPVVAYASTGGDNSTTSVVLAAVSLAVQTYVASRIAPLEKRVKRLEQAHGGVLE